MITRCESKSDARGTMSEFECFLKKTSLKELTLYTVLSKLHRVVKLVTCLKNLSHLPRVVIPKPFVVRLPSFRTSSIGHRTSINRSSPRPISTSQLHTSPRFHTWPINLIIFQGSYPSTQLNIYRLSLPILFVCDNQA